MDFLPFAIASLFGLKGDNNANVYKPTDLSPPSDPASTHRAAASPIQNDDDMSENMNMHRRASTVNSDSNDNEDGGTSSRDPSSSSNTDFSIVSELSATSDKACNVIEPRASLLPLCFNKHGKGKQRLREGSAFACRVGSKDDPQSACRKATISPPSASTQKDHAHVFSAEDDLKFWVQDADFEGGRDKGACEFVEEERFTDPMLRDTIIFAVQEANSLFAELDGWMEYGKRAPYNCNFSNVAPEADMEFLKVTSKQIDTFSRGVLQEELTRGGIEVVYLKDQVAQVKELIWGKKIEAAWRDGNEAERQALERMGVDWATV